MNASQLKRSLLFYPLAILSIPVGIAALWFLYAQYVGWRYERPFERVARGDTQERVEALLGHPHRVIEERQVKLAWASGTHEEYFDGESVIQFRYGPFSIAGDEYVIGFDRDKRAVSKYTITSP